jgi:hypothetical protein
MLFAFDTRSLLAMLARRVALVALPVAVLAIGAWLWLR